MGMEGWEMGLPGKRLGKRLKPLRSKLAKLLSEPIIIDEHSGPVRVSSELQGGKYVVKVEPVCPGDCQRVGAQEGTNLTQPPPKD